MQCFDSQFYTHRMADEVNRAVRVEPVQLIDHISKHPPGRLRPALRGPKRAACIPAEGNGQTFIGKARAETQMLRPAWAVIRQGAGT